MTLYYQLSKYYYLPHICKSVTVSLNQPLYLLKCGLTIPFHSLWSFQDHQKHHRQATYDSVWYVVDESWLFQPTQCFLFFSFLTLLGDFKLACLPHSWTEKSCVHNWGEKGEFGTAVLMAVRTTYETGIKLIGPVCLLQKRAYRVLNRQAPQNVCYWCMWRWNMIRGFLRDK